MEKIQGGHYTDNTGALGLFCFTGLPTFDPIVHPDVDQGEWKVGKRCHLMSSVPSIF